MSGLPAGWTWATVETICEHIVDCPHSTPRFQQAGYPCIDTNWMTTNGLNIDRARFVEKPSTKSGLRDWNQSLVILCLPERGRLGQQLRSQRE